jgi:hypothetical protein
MRDFLVQVNAPPAVAAAQDANMRNLVLANCNLGDLQTFEQEMGLTYTDFRNQHNLPANLTIRAFLDVANNPLPAGAGAAMTNAVNAYTNCNDEADV